MPRVGPMQLSLYKPCLAVREFKTADWTSTVIRQPPSNAPTAEAVLAGQVHDLGGGGKLLHADMAVQLEISATGSFLRPCNPLCILSQELGMADTFLFSLYQLSRLAGQNMPGEASDMYDYDYKFVRRLACIPPQHHLADMPFSTTPTSCAK